MTPTQTYWKNRPVVYRVFDEGDRLIYIGASRNLPARLVSHQAETWWMGLVGRIRVQVFPAIAAALAAEAVAIQEEQPMFNVRHTGRPEKNFTHWSLDDFHVCRDWQAANGRRMHLPQSSQPRMVWSA